MAYEQLDTTRNFPRENNYTRLGLEYKLRHLEDNLYKLTGGMKGQTRELLKQEDKLYLFKVKGCTFTMGTGNTAYSSPRYIIYLRWGESYYMQYDIEYNKKTMKEAKEKAFSKFEEILKREGER